MYHSHVLAQMQLTYLVVLVMEMPIFGRYHFFSHLPLSVFLTLVLIRLCEFAITNQVNKSKEDPAILKNHDGEVTAVDW